MVWSSCERRIPSGSRPTRIVPEPPSEACADDFEALLAAGGEMAGVAELVARYERSLIDSDAVPPLAEIERLLRIKRLLAGMATVERLNALTRRPRSPEAEHD